VVCERVFTGSIHPKSLGIVFEAFAELQYTPESGREAIEKMNVESSVQHFWQNHYTLRGAISKRCEKGIVSWALSAGCYACR
jgi:hypothetical protein